ncbi:hypothetical protein SAMN02910289_00764 [Lachnospiraceae bacterium RM5]|nr:hypothetical protein SAMN02910289_00764 [Lachnospiraceae bacterium RM5]
MQTIEFKMERPNLVKTGDEVVVDESVLQTLQGIMYYYTIKPAIAMSNNIPSRDRLKTDKGKVVKIDEKDGAFFVNVEFEEK